MGRDCMFRTGAMLPRANGGAEMLMAPALFLESLQHGEWINEDHAFCLRARMSRVELVSIVHADVVHDGMVTIDR